MLGKPTLGLCFLCPYCLCHFNSRNIDWMKYSWRAENWRTNTLKSPVPHGFNIYKGSAHIVASRAFVEFALNDEKARDLQEWMRDTRLPDEHFFNTLNHNPHFGVPGAYKGTCRVQLHLSRVHCVTSDSQAAWCSAWVHVVSGDPGLKSFYTRFKLWWENESSQCSGLWSRYICNIGVAELTSLRTSKHLFLNKVRRDVSPIAYECLSQWHFNRTLSSNKSDVDLDFYKSLRFVQNHV